MTERVDILISVIIPTYNYARLLPRALDSVLSQLSPDVEVIVVNDGSTDDTAAVLDDYAARHPQLRLIEQANRGAAAARNAGVREARGPYALLLDADDELLPDALTALRAVIAKHPAAGMVLGGYISVYPDGHERTRLPTSLPVASPARLVERYLLDKRISISHSCSLFRRDLLLRRPYPENLRGGEDVAVFAHLLISAPVAVSKQALARIYKHADSLRHNRDNEEERALTMTSEIFAGLPAECQSLRERYAARRYLSLFRRAQLAGDSADARRFYRCAWRLSPLQALRWQNLRRALRLLKRSPA